MASTSQHRCVFVGNIPYDATEEQLVQICEEVGPVVSFRLVLDRETGKPKGYGFCEYKDEETALSARRNLHGYEINGRQLRVDFAENDKSADRNREQGRGGPGLASNADNRISSGPTTSGSVAAHQPIGVQLSATAASVMTGALGGGQSQHGSENDRLTQYLAQMSKNQLAELMSEVKALSTQNKALAHKLLQNNPQFCKALFQAQIMLGMVTPQMLQMVHTKQSSSSNFPSQMHDNRPTTISHNALPLALSNVTQIGTSLRPQEAPPSTLPLNPLDQQHIPIQSRFQPLPETQSQLLLQGIVSGKPGYLSAPSAQPLTLTNRNLPPTVHLAPSSGLVTSISQQPRPSVMQNVGQHSQLSFPNSSAQKTALQQPLSQVGSLSYTPTLSMPLEASVEGGMSGPHSGNPSMGLTVDMPPSSVMRSMEQANVAKMVFDPVSRPSKLSRLEDGSRAPITTSSHACAVASGPAQATSLPSVSTGQVAGSDRTLDGDGQLSQFLPEAEAALLKQVMSLTAEQLNSLPPEQRQQVIQLQQMLKS